MKQFIKTCLFAFFLGSILTTSLAWADDISILVYSQTNGYRHKSIEAGHEAMKKMAAQNGWQITITEDSTDINDEVLSGTDALIFLNTSGNILNDQQEHALQNYIRNGGGFAGIHSATDTEGENSWYVKLLGARFKGHPEIQKATVNVHKDQNHKTIHHLPEKWSRKDEWYNFKEPVADYANVLIDLDESTVNGEVMNMFHPLSWYHKFEGGRVFYTAMGHTKASYRENAFLKHVEGGIEWVIRR